MIGVLRAVATAGINVAIATLQEWSRATVY